MEDVLANLDEEKRDRILNSAIEEFSLYPYDKASTNNIVKNAGISKGLLFHYFGNKKELYEKLIEFVLNKLVNDMTSQIDWEETDMFERIKNLVIVKMKLAKIYPNMFDFLIKVMTKNQTSSMENIINFYESYGVDVQRLLADVYTKNIDYTLFADQTTIDKSINIIRWTLEKYSEEYLAGLNDLKAIDYVNIVTELDGYINVLKKTFYNN